MEFNEQVRLSYFPIYGRGLAPILLLEMSGLDWVGRPLTEEWASVKSSGIAPFGQLPILEDKTNNMVLGQSNAIGGHIARISPNYKDKLCLKDHATSDMLMCASEDLFGMLNRNVPTIYAPLGSPFKGDKAHYDKFESELLPGFLGRLENLAKDEGKFTSIGVSPGEIFLFSTLFQTAKVFPNAFDAFPKVKKFYEAVLNRPETQKVLEGKSKFGPIGQYYIAA